MPQNSPGLDRLQLFVNNLFDLRGVSAKLPEVEQIAIWLLGDAVDLALMPVVFRIWVLSELVPASLRVKQAITQDDLLDDAIREFLVLAIPAGMLGHYQLPAQFAQVSGKPELLADALNIDISTLYRIQRQARARLAGLLHVILSSNTCWVARFSKALFRVFGPDEPEARRNWHIRHAALCELRTDGLAMAWHLINAGDWDDMVVRLHRRAYEIAEAGNASLMPNVHAQIEWFIADAPTLKHVSRLQRIHASVYDAMGDLSARLAALEVALRSAVLSKDSHAIANAYLDLARYYSIRDADKAEGLFRVCIERFEQISDVSACAEDYCYALIQYALAQTLKYNSAAIGIMRRAEKLPLPALCQARGNLSLERGTIEWRVGNYAGAIECYAYAAALYEGLNDQINLRTAHFNIGLCHLSMGNTAAALALFNRVIDGPSASSASISDKANWFLTRADCYRQMKEFERGIAELACALQLLRQTHDPHTEAEVYDLVARIHLECFRRTELLEHQLGCSNAASALYTLAERHPFLRILANKLREDIAKHDLDDHNQERFLAVQPERAVNFAELSEIDRLRQQSIADPDPAQQLNARLGIARIYLELSIKERQNALTLAEEHNLLASTTEAVMAMADRHARTLDSRDRLISRWQELSGLDVALIQAVLTHFEQHGALTKKAYVALSGVSPATASRVLARLVESGLVVQQGAGASSRYVRIPG